MRINKMFWHAISPYSQRCGRRPIVQMKHQLYHVYIWYWYWWLLLLLSLLTVSSLHWPLLSVAIHGEPLYCLVQCIIYNDSVPQTDQCETDVLPRPKQNNNCITAEFVGNQLSPTNIYHYHDSWQDLSTRASFSIIKWLTCNDKWYKLLLPVFFCPRPERSAGGI